MQIVRNNLVKIWQETTDPTHKQLLADSIKRLEIIMPVVENWQKTTHEFVKVIHAAQQSKFIGFKKPQARFLSREIDRYKPCANSS